MEIKKDKIIQIFKDYTSDYDLSDPKIKLKYDHTFRVANMCEEIAESISMTKEQCELAWLIGMLHDIGRFEQVRRYGTFADAESIDHAHFGADLLFKEGLFERFIEPLVSDFSSETSESEKQEFERNRTMIETAIRNHSAYRIQEGLDEEMLTFCQVIRDADKIDILRVNWETPIEDIYNVTTEELKKAEVTKEVKAAFDEHHCVLRKLKRTPIDHIVGHVSLCFELVYPISMELVKKQGYLAKLLSFQSENEDTNQWFAYMKSVML